MRRVFIGTKMHKNLMLVVILATRNLIPHFQGHKIFVKTNYHVRQAPKKIDLDGMMVYLVV